jgi:hypothetical protein
MELYACSKCGATKPRNDFHEAQERDRDRPVTSQCKECRSEAYYQKRYPDSVCSQCSKHRQLDRNGQCGDCNAAAGLRECNECKELLPIPLAYYEGKRDRCKVCLRLKRQKRK